MATNIQFLRATTKGLRPDPTRLSLGTPMVNLHPDDPGLYFRLANDKLGKFGPIHVGPKPPNDSPVGSVGNLEGELWVDTSESEAAWKYWAADGWKPITSGQNVPDIGGFPPANPDPGDFWYDINNQILYMWDGNTWLDVQKKARGTQGSVQFNQGGEIEGVLEFTYDSLANTLHVPRVEFNDGTNISSLGNNEEIPYNSNGALSTSDRFKWSETSNTLTAQGNVVLGIDGESGSTTSYNDTLFKESVTVEGPLTLLDSLSVAKDMTVGGSASIGSSHLDTLTVKSTTTFENNVTVGDDRGDTFHSYGVSNLSGNVKIGTAGEDDELLINSAHTHIDGLVKLENDAILEQWYLERISNVEADDAQQGSVLIKEGNKWVPADHLFPCLSMPLVISPSAGSSPDACVLEFVGSIPVRFACGEWVEAIWEVSTDDFATVMVDTKPITNPTTTQRLAVEDRVNIKLEVDKAYKVRVTYKLGDVYSPTSDEVEFTTGYSPGWYPLNAPEQARWREVVYGDGKFVAIAAVKFAESDTCQFPAMYSPDGVNWTSSPNVPRQTWQGLHYHDGMFVAVGKDSATYPGGSTKDAMYSTDGINWSLADTPPATNNWASVTYGDGKWVASCSKPNGAGKGYIMWSTDGINWTLVDNAVDAPMFEIHYGDGMFVGVGLDYGYVHRSTDGINWTSTRNALDNNQWLSVTYGNGKWIATAQTGDKRIGYSTDAITWTTTQSDPPGNGWTSVTFGCDRFVAVARNNVGPPGSPPDIDDNNERIMSSVDGINWTVEKIEEGMDDTYFESIVYGAGTYVAVGGFELSDNQIMYSYTGTNVLASSLFYDEYNYKAVTNREVVRRFGYDPETVDLAYLGIVKLTEQPTGDVLAYVRSGSQYSPVPDHSTQLAALTQRIAELES